MKVSEAVERLRVYVDESDGFVSVPNADLVALLKSHEALRLAGEGMIAANHPNGSIQEFSQAHDALSLAVEEAGR